MPHLIVGVGIAEPPATGRTVHGCGRITWLIAGGHALAQTLYIRWFWVFLLHGAPRVTGTSVYLNWIRRAREVRGNRTIIVRCCQKELWRTASTRQARPDWMCYGRRHPADKIMRFSITLGVKSAAACEQTTCADVAYSCPSRSSIRY